MERETTTIDKLDTDHMHVSVKSTPRINSNPTYRYEIVRDSGAVIDIYFGNAGLWQSIAFPRYNITKAITEEGTSLLLDRSEDYTYVFVPNDQPEDIIIHTIPTFLDGTKLRYFKL